ncbi:hypothetical protein [Escherichia coli]|uniref:hypothetical protein n=1 Tax=Escherichia coli TaxID=562 RepID=UPI000BE2113C|nr:hypothetical protein [Escherichia coli]
MNIIRLEGFQQIPANRELCSNYTPTDIIMALKENGVTLVNEQSGSVTSVCRGTQTVNTVERTGLVFTTPSWVMLYCTLPDLKKSAVQLGFRLTLSQGKKSSSSLSCIRIGGNTFTTPYPDEAASYYYEIFATRNEDGNVSASLYCNCALVGETSFYVSDGQTDKIQVGIGSSYSIFSSGASGTLMLGDMYCGTVTYGKNNSAAPGLLGSIDVRYSEVKTFTGENAKNSQDKDIVAGLNTSDSAAGYLMLSPSAAAATATLTPVDNSGNNLVAVMASVTYRSADAPNNRLAWKVSSGSNEGAIVSENAVYGDTNSWTTVMQSFMGLPGGDKPFSAGEMTFAVSLYNQEKTTSGRETVERTVVD